MTYEREILRRGYVGGGDLRGIRIPRSRAGARASGEGCVAVAATAVRPQVLSEPVSDCRRRRRRAPVSITPAGRRVRRPAAARTILPVRARSTYSTDRYERRTLY